MDQQGLAEYRCWALHEVLGGSQVAERMPVPSCAVAFHEMSVVPCSVRRMTEHDLWCGSTARGVEERLRFLCLQAELVQAQLANALGTTRYAIARGLHRTSLDVINRVATAIKHESAMLIEQKVIA